MVYNRIQQQAITQAANPKVHTMIYSLTSDSADNAATTLMQQIHADNAQAENDSRKAMLRSLFARHHRAIAKEYYHDADRSQARKHQAKARRLEAQVADYANDLSY